MEFEGIFISHHNEEGFPLTKKGIKEFLDEHKHNSISLIGTYHFDSGFTVAFAPGILFSEHEGETETEELTRQEIDLKEFQTLPDEQKQKYIVNRITKNTFEAWE